MPKIVENDAGDRYVLCDLLHLITAIADHEVENWLEGMSLSQWFDLLLDDRRLEDFAVMEPGYLGTPTALPAALSEFDSQLLNISSIELNNESESDVRSLSGSDLWLQAEATATTIKLLVKDWCCSHCGPEWDTDVAP